MKKLLLASVAVLALAGCKKEEAAPAASDTASAMAPSASSMAPAASAKPMTLADLTGTWDDTMADGSKSVTTFAADGTYQDTDAKGVVEHGKAEIKDGKVCMTASDGPNKGKTMCWATSAPAADGSLTATGDDGTKITVKKRAA